jgi:hypothetical protein
MGLHGLLRGYFNFLKVVDIHTSQETHVWASTACYGDSFSFVCVDDVSTSQETHYRPPRPVTGIVLLSNIGI